MRPPWDFVLFAAVAVAATFAVVRLARPSRSGRLALLALAVALLGGGLYVESAGRTATGEIERLVSAMAPTYARELERLGHADLPLDAEPADPRYLELIEAEKRWLAANREIADIYTFRRLPDGRIVFLVDSETDYDHDGRFEGARESRTAIGEPVPQPATSLIAATSSQVAPASPGSGNHGSATLPPACANGASGGNTAVATAAPSALTTTRSRNAGDCSCRYTPRSSTTR